MSWKSIEETTQETSYAVAAQNLVARIDSQLQNFEQFLNESQSLAAGDPHLSSIRSDIEAVYQSAQETLEFIGEQNHEQVGHIHTLGALAQVSSGLDIVMDTDDPKDGWGPVADFYRAVNEPNTEQALAIEDETARQDYVNERRQGWAEGRLQKNIGFAHVSHAFAEASIEFRKNQVDPNYTPDENRSFEAIPSMHDEGRKMMTMNIYGEDQGISFDPVDIEAQILYQNLDALRITQAVPGNDVGTILEDTTLDRVHEINLNVLARGFSGEYGDTINIQGFRSDKIDVESLDPDLAIAAMVHRSGVTYNPINHSFGATDSSGYVEDNFLLPNSDHLRDHLMPGFREEDQVLQQRFDTLTELVEQSDGQRIPTSQIYEALGQDPGGPNYSLPPAMTYTQIQQDISALETKISMLEDLIENPTGTNFQDTLTENNTSVESLLLDLKRSIWDNRYEPGVAAQTYGQLHEAGNFEQRLESILGVPLIESRSISLENSPLLHALNHNFQTFHPPADNAAEIPEIQDGASQLGEALSARGGAVILDNHSQVEPVKFMYDSLPEIAAKGSTVILVENTIDLNSRDLGTMVLLNQKDPIEKFYETGNADYLSSLKSGFALQAEQEIQRLEQIGQTRVLEDHEQARLDDLRPRLFEMHARDALEATLIEEAYTQHGIKFEFFGGGIEGRFAEEFGMDARFIASNYGWDEQITRAGQDTQNVIVWAGAAHFIDDIVGDRGDMVLDESLSYPTFSLGQDDPLFNGKADYNLTQGADNRWVPLGHATALEVAPTQEPIMTDEPALDTTPMRP